MIQIPLTRGYVAIIDDEDGYLADHKWHALVCRGGLVYGMRSLPKIQGRRKAILLHRAVLSLEATDPLVDHRDGDGLNCRRGNLVLSTSQRNQWNRAGANADNVSSGLLGVSAHKASGKWQAYIGFDGKQKHLGLFTTFDEATTARLAAERQHWGVQPRRMEAHV